jgi:protein-disulfide isomerase
VRLAYVNFPLQMHAHALQAAEAAMCAAAQKRFWPMHDSLFVSQGRWSDKSDSVASAIFDSLATRVGADSQLWRDCVRSGVMRRLITADRGRGTAAGVRSTPTFFVGDEPIQGAAPAAVFRAAIERARAKAATRGASSSPAPPPSAAPPSD